MYKKASIIAIMCIFASSCAKEVSCSSDGTTKTVKSIIDQKLRTQMTFMGVHEYEKSSFTLVGIRTNSSTKNQASCTADINFHKVYSEAWGEQRNVVPRSGDSNDVFEITYDASLTDDGKDTYVKIKTLTFRQ